MEDQVSSRMILEAMGLAIGETLRTVCPRCGGGNSNERTCTITRNDGRTISWFCHRASCDLRGSTGSSVEELPGVVYTTKYHEFKGSKVYYDAHLEDLMTRFGIDKSVASRLYGGTATRDGRYMLECYDYEGRTWGYVGRSYTGLKPKTIMYQHRESSKLGWFRADRERTVVLVEDLVSAAKVSQHCNAAALLGTHLTKEMLDDLVIHCDEVYIWLDPDATNKASKLGRELSLVFPVCKVLVSEQDPKDLPHNRIGEILERAEAIKCAGDQPSGVPQSGEAAR